MIINILGFEYNNEMKKVCNGTIDYLLEEPISKEALFEKKK
jgi:hypothetical protein